MELTIALPLGLLFGGAVEKERSVCCTVFVAGLMGIRFSDDKFARWNHQPHCGNTFRSESLRSGGQKLRSDTHDKIERRVPLIRVAMGVGLIAGALCRRHAFGRRVFDHQVHR